MSRTVFFFPGQGSQFPGMAQDLYAKHSKVRTIFEQASDVCGRDMKALLFDSSEEELKDTKNAQPAIVLASLAAREAMAAEGITSTCTAGHSLGEYSALVDAGVLTVEDGLKAVLARGECMASAGAEITKQRGKVGMAAVLGMAPQKVNEVLAGHSDVWSANENSPSQVAIGGTLSAIERATEQLKAAGARRIIPLKVSCPFHTPLMTATAETMQAVFEELQFSDPKKTVWSNVLALPITTGQQARSLLVEQITHPVRWVALMESVTEKPFTACYEVGPGKVLRGLWAQAGHEGICHPAGSIKDIDTIKKGVESHVT